jgi:uncharacterized repeat protein (TIGR03803 family)
MKKVREPATSRIHGQLLIGLVGALVVMSVVVLSGQELKHVPPAAPSYTVLYSFNPDNGIDGSGPNGVIRDTAGNLYGTTFGGGSGACTSGTIIIGCGTAFKLSPTGTQTVLYNFTGGAYFPAAGLIQDAVGNLYGTTEFGGLQSNPSCLQFSSTSGGCGVVFKLTPSGTATGLYSFTGGADGANPLAGLIRDAAGNLYGTTYLGGSATNPGCGPSIGCGVVFKLSPAGAETVLHSFTDGADGGLPTAGLILDAAGNLYGTASFGGGSGYGVVFKVSSCGSRFKVLYSFTGGADGGFPTAGLIQDPAGNLYGTTFGGGAKSSACIPYVSNLSRTCGVVFKLSPTGAETVLHTFAGGADGGNPAAGLVRDAAGNLYGTTLVGGPESSACGTLGCGTVFKLTPSGTETVLHSFTGADGANTSAGLILDAASILYGTTNGGGAYRGGVVFRLTP